MTEEYSFRKQLFLHLDGIVLIPILLLLIDLKILEYLQSKKKITIEELNNRFNVNIGYTNVIFRSLLSVGIFSINELEKFQLSKQFYCDSTKIGTIMKYANHINSFYRLLPIYINFEELYKNNSLNYNQINHCNNILLELKEVLLNSKSSFNKELYYYFEGFYIGPLLSYQGYLKLSLFNSKKNFNASYKHIMLTQNHILDINKNELTDKGIFFNNRLSSYGVTTSYLQMFHSLEDTLIHNNNVIWDRDNKGNEIHINRKMNVWGSGKTHKYYFNKIDSILLDIFNRDLSLQPKGIVDIGCGDGTFLKHCYDFITSQTIRKDFMDANPLKLIGVDINKAARVATRQTLNKYNIDSIIINGNISDPSNINKLLITAYGEELNNFVSTRTFLDHNRMYSPANEIITNNIKTTGTFCYKGELINCNDIINNLIEHFINWKKYSNKYGIIILELHTIDPLISKRYRGKTLSCSYDTTHGLSDQYLIEYDAFVNCAKLANLKLAKKSDLFPDNFKPTVSVNHFILVILLQLELYYKVTL